MSWKPWHLILWLPDSQKLTIDGEVLGIDGQKLHASLRAKPSLDVAAGLRRSRRASAPDSFGGAPGSPRSACGSRRRMAALLRWRLSITSAPR